MSQIDSLRLSQRDIRNLHEYYCSERDMHGRKLSIYDIWDAGGAFKDSVTPSCYSSEYRSHITLKILSITKDGDRIFSIGCGNGFVEAELIKAGRQVEAIDCNDEAVKLAKEKGVTAYTADFFDLREGQLANCDVLYADGLLGHLFRSETQLEGFFSKLFILGMRSSTRLIVSNDPPRDPGIDFSPHDKIDNFWFLSRTFLAETFESHGYRSDESYYFPYFRPISGLRNRSICIVTHQAKTG